MTTIDEAHKARLQADHEQLERDMAALELPEVADVAGPILRALMPLHDFGAYRFDSSRLGFEYADCDRYQDETARIVRFVEDVATAVEIGVASYIPHPERSSHPSNARAIVLAIFDLEGLRECFYDKAKSAMMYPDDEAGS